MATVIYLPPDYGGVSPGEAIGRGIGAYTRKTMADKDKEKRAKVLSNLFDSIRTGDDKGAKQAISSGAITDADDLISLVSALRNQRRGDTIKVPAWNSAGKEVPYAVSKEDLASGTAEQKANRLDLTLANPGKQEDYYHDAPQLKFLGTGTKKTRPGKALTLEEWKAKYQTGKKATDKDKSITDYLKNAQLDNTATNRTRVRQYLEGAKKAIEVVNARFGKKTGNDWTFDDPEKAQAAAMAKAMVEPLIVHHGFSPEAAGNKAIEFATQRFDTDREEGGLDAANKALGEKKGLIDSVIDMLKGSGQEAKEAADNPDKKSEVTGEEYLGTINNQEVFYPATMDDPVDIMEHISKRYNIPQEDVRQWLINNAPD